MRTIEHQIFRYDELSEQAQQVAIESMKDEISSVRTESESYEYRNALDKIENLFGVNVYDYHVDEYNYYFRFKFTNIGEEKENEPRLLLRYLNTNVLPCIDNKKRYYSKTARVSRRSRILCNKSYDYCLTGCWYDESVDNALNNINQSVKNHLSAREFVESILEGFFEQWRRDYEYTCSDECIAEEIETNDYEFYENGKPYFA